MAYAFEDLEAELGRKVLKVGSQRILKIFEVFGGVVKEYAQRTELRKEFSGRIPFPKDPKIELCIYIQQPLSRITVFHEGEYKEAERSRLNLKPAFVSIWMEDTKTKSFIGQSVIPPSLGFSKIDLDAFKLSSPEIFEEVRALINDFIVSL